MKTQFQKQSKRINIHLTGAENGGTSVSLSSNLVEKVMRPFEPITEHGKTKPKQTRINENYYWHPIENHANAGNGVREITGSNIHRLIVPLGLSVSITACSFQKPILHYFRNPTHTFNYSLKIHYLRTSKCIEIALFQSPAISLFIKHYFLCTSRPFVLSHPWSWYAITRVNNFLEVTNYRLSTRLKALPRSLYYLKFVCWSS